MKSPTRPITIRFFVRKILFVVAIAMSTVQVYAAATANLQSMELRTIHLGFALVLIYLSAIANREDKLCARDILNLVLCLAAIFVCGYAHIEWETLMLESAYPSTMQLIVGGVLIILVLDGTQRKLGFAVPVIALLFILYGLFGEFIPHAGHKGYQAWRIISTLTMATEGIYGSVLGVSATYIFLFVLFGAFLDRSGASLFFINLAMALFGKSRGGPAKVAILGSCLFGSISGSAVANVMTTGVVTIPMMRRVGYQPVFAGALEACASTGGQIMPPIMGAAAFIIAETLEIPYLKVCAGALVPALMYYLALWFVIDLRARKENILPLEDSEIPDWKEVLSKGFLLAMPILMLVFFLAILNWSPLKAGLWSIATLLLATSVRKETRFTLKTLLEAMHAGAMASLSVAMVCAAAGIIIGILGLTGLGLKFSQLLVTFSFGLKPVLLGLTMIAGLILGMGMTTTSVYIILSVLIAPALVKMDVLPLSAHLFAFYFGILSSITPPVAVASFAAASITESSPMGTGFMSFRIGIAGFIVPFMFIYSPELLMEGRVLDIFQAIITASLGIFMLSAGMEGYFTRIISMPLRVLLISGALLLIDSGIITDIAGLVILGSSYCLSRFTNQNVFA